MEERNGQVRKERSGDGRKVVSKGKGSAPSKRGSDVREGLRAGMPIRLEEGGNTGRNPIAWAAKPRDRRIVSIT